MQIKCIKILMLLLLVFLPTLSNAAISDWFTESCKQVIDQNGLSTRKNDIAKNSEFKNAKFYRGLCSDKKASSGQSYCVKMFKDAQVHDMNQAIQIAKDYAQQYNKDVITCHPDYWSCKDADDHILCSTANNSAHYEFIFDDITEKSDAKYKEGIANAYCKIFFGEQSTLEKKNQANSNSTVSSNDMLNCWPPESYKTDYIYDTCKNMGETMESSFGYYTAPSKYDCPINFRTIDCSFANNDTFKTLQVNLDSNTVAWLAGYVQKQKNNTINEFKCDLAAHSCNTGDFKNPKDDILTCYADGERMDFLFDDLSETKSAWVKGSQDAAECINTDGIYDGRRCQGISEASCDALQNKGIDIKWDKTLQACVLKSANSVANLNRAAEIASTVGIAAGIVVATVATGGGSTMVMLAVGGAAAATGSQTITSVERGKIDTFISDLLACKAVPKSHTERECVRDKFIWFMDHGSNYINNLTSAQIDAIDKAVSQKISAIDMNSKDGRDLLNAFEKSKDKSMWERCTGDMLQTSKCTLDAASIILDFLPVTKAALKAPEVLGVFVTKIGTKMPKTAKVLSTLRTSSNIVKKGLTAIDKVDTINDITTAATAAGAF